MRKVVVWVLMILGAALGAESVYLLTNYFKATQFFGFDFSGSNSFILVLFGGAIGGIIFYLISSWLINFGKESTTRVERMLQKIPTGEMLVGAIGLITGLVIAYLISSGPIKLIPFAWLGTLLSILVYLLLGYLGVSIATKKREDIFGLLISWKKLVQKDKEKPAAKVESIIQPKILDTSVIIDGRILDICRTGFIEGELIVPDFVLEELRHLADAHDDLIRAKGRRGLDVLNYLKKDSITPVKTVKTKYDASIEVDERLMQYAKDEKACIITNDYNLNKVASIKGISILNINDLSNALKPLAVTGEEMTVKIVKEGKENGQGVGYLDDGTMVVVERTYKDKGCEVDIVVTSVLQTSAGRMIFESQKLRIYLLLKAKFILNQ